MWMSEARDTTANSSSRITSSGAGVSGDSRLDGDVSRAWCWISSNRSDRKSSSARWIDTPGDRTGTTDNPVRRSISFRVRRSRGSSIATGSVLSRRSNAISVFCLQKSSGSSLRASRLTSETFRSMKETPHALAICSSRKR